MSITANTSTKKTEALPISWNQFLNVGFVCYDYPNTVIKISVAITCSLTDVTIGALTETSATPYLRYIVFGK